MIRGSRIQWTDFISIESRILWRYAFNASGTVPDGINNVVLFDQPTTLHIKEIIPA